jgi:hypothetical protein
MNFPSGFAYALVRVSKLVPVMFRVPIVAQKKPRQFVALNAIGLPLYAVALVRS